MNIALTAGCVALLSYLAYLGQIVVHCCVHRSLFRKSKRLNEIVGTILCAVQLTHFEGWRSAHMLHHRFANTEGDPHQVDRPLLPYLLTHYFRVARRVWAPRRFFAAVSPPIALVVAVIVWQAAIGRGLRGLEWGLLYWLTPTAIGHLLVAHFNYVTHVGLPKGRGWDTRSLGTGAWRIVNPLTLNFYLHAEHHLRPGEAIPRAASHVRAPRGNDVRERRRFDGT